MNSEIKQLGGSISIDSTFCKGSEFTIQIPFTVSINRALLVVVREEKVVGRMVRRSSSVLLASPFLVLVVSTTTLTIIMTIVTIAVTMIQSWEKST